MSRILLIGRAGSGKTHACLERLVEARGKLGLLLVPTYSQAEHLRYALLDRLGGVSQRLIHTFTSLAEKFGDCRLGELVPESRRDRLAADVLRQPFGEAADRPGFRAEFLAAVKEIKEQGRPIAEGLESVRRQFPDEHRARKLFEAAAVYAERLPGLDHEDLLLRTREAELPALDLLLVDGFHDFTPVQRQIIDRLAQGAAEAVVTLPAGYQTADRTAASFPGWERQELTENRRCKEDLAALERGLFREASSTHAQSTRILAAASEEDEADRLARFVARSGRPAKDFLLIRRGWDGRHSLFRSVFARYGVPIRFFGSEPLASGPLARTLEQFLRSRFSDVAIPPSPYYLGETEGTLAQQLATSFGLETVLEAHPDGDAALAHAARLLAAVRDEAAAVDDLAVADAARIVLRRLPQLRSTLPDRRHDCVYAVEAKEARQWEKPVVLVSGLDATSFPRPVRQDLFLRDDERRELIERGYTLPLRERQEDEERYLFYVCLTRAREQLVLSWAAYDEQGTEVPGSPFLHEVRRVLPDVPETKVRLAEQYVPARDAVRPADLLPIVADGLSRVDHGEAALAAALHEKGAVDRALLAWPRRLELLRLRPLPDLPKDPAAHLSASRIKSYRRCPYLLLQKMLKADKPREEELDAALRGNIAHDTLEQLAKGGDVDEVFDATFEKLAGHLQLGVLGRAWKKRMRTWVHYGYEGLERADVLDVEKKFDDPVGDVTLHGRIDRIDRCEAGEIVRDYKTGARIDDEDERQLDVYMLARDDAVGAVFELLRAEEQRGYVRDDVELGFGKKVERLSADEIAARRNAMRGIIAAIAAAARAGHLNVAPREPDRCTRDGCDGYDLCRVAKARWLARVAREAEG
ncbi:MAG: PD-(D/E)XK nuclease family protein [Planctomycetota bacterium]